MTLAPLLVAILLFLTTAQDAAAALPGADQGDRTAGHRYSKNVSQTWSKLDDSSLIEVLQQGGYVIVFRHAATSWEESDDHRGNFEDCTRQRNLSIEGKLQAAAVGETFAVLGIPVGKVMASPMCRTRDTATLAFARVQSTRSLLGRASAEDLNALFSAPPAPGTNTVLVTHQASIRRVTDFAQNEVEEGNCIVLRPQTGGRFVVVAHLSFGDWERLNRRRVR